MFNNERINNLEEKADELKKSISYLESRVGYLERQANKAEPNNRWRHDNKYLSSYCPKCKDNNRSQIPVRSKRSMQFTCGECNTIYRVYFDREDIEEGGE